MPFTEVYGNIQKEADMIFEDSRMYTTVVKILYTLSTKQLFQRP